MAEKDGGQSGNLDMTLDNPPQDISEQFKRRWYQPGSEIEQEIETRAFLSIAGYVHAVQVHDLNFTHAETSISVDENSTFIQIGLLLHSSEGKEVPVALEQTCGPFPKWSIPNINSKIKGGIQKVYAADIAKPFTLALVRDVGEDFPLLIPLESLNDNTRTMGDLVGSLLPGRAKQGSSIRLLSSPEEIQTMPCGQIQEHIKEHYSTTIFVLLTNSPEEYKFRYDYDYEGPSPLPLKVAFLQCLDLVDAAGKLETCPLQAIHLSQALLHLVICVAEVDRSKMENSLNAYYISRVNSLVIRLQSILANESSTLTSQSLQEFFEEICEEHPGVVAVRQSFESFQALAFLDHRNRGTLSESLDTNTAVPRDVSHQNSGLLQDASSRMVLEEAESASSEPPGHTAQSGRIPSGVYVITNVLQRCSVSFGAPGDELPLRVHYTSETDSEQCHWRVRELMNGHHSIQNVKYERYANCGSRAGLRALVWGDNSEQQWYIQATRFRGEYTIATIYNRNFWMLPDNENDTPVELSNVPTDSRCRWTFTNIETGAQVYEDAANP